MTVLKTLLTRALLSGRIAPAALRLVLVAHNFLYDLCGPLAVAANGGTHPKHRLLRYKEWFVDHIGADFVVLDVGSNTGGMAALLAGKAKQVYAIEIDKRLSEIAKRTNAAPNIEFLTGDATTFDYSGCALLDCVTLSNVLEHIDNRVDFLRMLRQRLPWRNPDSCTFLIRVPTIEREWLSVYKKEIGIEYRLDRTHKIEHTKQEFMAEIAAAGLQIAEFGVHFGEFYAVCHGNTA